MMEGLQGMERPIPGQSLTNDPNNPAPYEKPPKHTSLKKAQEDIFDKLIQEETYVPIMELIDSGEATIMEVTQNLLYSGFRAGQWNPDLMLMLAEPTAYMIMALAEKAGIDYKVDNESEEEEEEPAKLERLSAALKQKAPAKADVTALPSEIQTRLKEEAPDSLITKPSSMEMNDATQA